MPNIFTDSGAVRSATDNIRNATDRAASHLRSQVPTATDARFAQIASQTNDNSSDTVKKTEEKAEGTDEASQAITETDEESSAGVEETGGTPASSRSSRGAPGDDEAPSLPSANRDGDSASNVNALKEMMGGNSDAAESDSSAMDAGLAAAEDQAVQQAQAQQMQEQQQYQAQMDAQQQQAMQQQAMEAEAARQQQYQDAIAAQQQAAMQQGNVPTPDMGVTDGGGMTLTRDQLSQVIDQINANAETADVTGSAGGEVGDGSTFESAGLDGEARGDTEGSAPFYLGEPSDEGLLDPANVTFERDPEEATLSSDEADAVIDEAMDANGITDPEARAKWGALMLHVGAHESSFVVNAGNGYDSNAHGEQQEDGLPFNSSRGTWQTIPTTFASNHVEGTSTSIYDPTASCAAAINYVMERYGADVHGNGVDEFYAARPEGAYIGY